MPGALPHLIAGSAMFIIGRYYFKNYFDGYDKTKERFLLAVVCISFSLLPDFVLIIYYITHILPFEAVLPYHDFTLFVSAPIAIGGLVMLKFWGNVKRKPVWIMGLWCILLHVVMDLFIGESGVWI